MKLLFSWSRKPVVEHEENSALSKWDRIGLLSVLICVCARAKVCISGRKQRQRGRFEKESRNNADERENISYIQEKRFPTKLFSLDNELTRHKIDCVEFGNFVSNLSHCYSLLLYLPICLSPPLFVVIFVVLFLSALSLFLSSNISICIYTVLPSLSQSVLTHRSYFLPVSA